MDITDIDRGNTAHSNCAGRQYDEDEEEEPFEARQPSSTHQPAGFVMSLWVSPFRLSAFPAFKCRSLDQALGIWQNLAG